MTARFILPRPERRQRGAAILPLINVVFLLLMFIVLAGVIRSPDPFTLTPAQALQGEETEPAYPERTLYVSAAGDLRFRSAEGEDAILAEIARLASGNELETITVHADAGTPAARIVKLVERLRATGVARVELQAERKQ